VPGERSAHTIKLGVHLFTEFIINGNQVRHADILPDLEAQQNGTSGRTE